MFLLRIFSGVIAGMVRSLFGLAFVLGIPLVGFVFIFFGIFFAIQKINQKSNFGEKFFQTGWENPSSTISNDVISGMSNEERREIERALKEFFKTRDRLIIYEDVSLRPWKGRFMNISSLVLYKGDEAIAMMGDLNSSNPEICQKIVDFLTGKSEARRMSDVSKKEMPNSRANEFIKKIEDVNVQIPDSRITNGLYETVELLKDVRVLEQKEPDSEKLRKLYEYYLPIMMSVLHKFKNVKSTPNSKVYLETHDQLVQTIDMINEALGNITKDHFGEEMTDINVDAKTLQSILRKDGVVGSGLMFPSVASDTVMEEKSKEEQAVANDMPFELTLGGKSEGATEEEVGEVHHG